MPLELATMRRRGGVTIGPPSKQHSKSLIMTRRTQRLCKTFLDSLLRPLLFVRHRHRTMIYPDEPRTL